MIDWKPLPHEVPKEMEPYLMMLVDACAADNELKVLTRFQKTLRKIYDDQFEIREKAWKYDELCK